MTSSEIRNSFLKFFEERGHAVVPSSSVVVPYDDPTLLFTNAGMNQFKDVFLATGKRNYTRAVDTQKCIRVSGKHNDLEEVGRDTYHHTFFEMLGNWSFGDYYKKEAIAWAWELLTKVWGLPKDRLWATVYNDDDEADQLWKSVTDINHSHVLRFGEKDNFWEMGETGPCGPCSEIHIDRTPNGSATAAMVNAGLPELMEIWNLVFIQYNRDNTGKLTPLPAKHVDTGMGFERVCAVLQNKNSNYDTDVFTPLIKRISEVTKQTYDGSLHSAVGNRQSEIDVAMRVIADHVRTLTFAIGDGALPSNEGRGYVLRRILRRAARFGRNLEMREPFIYQLVKTLVDTMSYIFPEIKEKQEHIQRVIRGEEEGFNATLDRGLEEFERVVKRLRDSRQSNEWNLFAFLKRIKTGKKISAPSLINGEDAFKLYDTFGFPLDLTQLMAEERGLSIDVKSFHALMAEQRERSRKQSLLSVYGFIETKEKYNENYIETEFVGYDSFEVRSELASYGRTTAGGAKEYRPEADEVVLFKTSFYGESGGQVGDIGTIVGIDEEFEFIVTDTKKRDRDIVHVGKLVKGKLEDFGPKDFKIIGKINPSRRLSIMRNHTATHLVHEALRRVLGEHLHQQGSLVDDKHLRFDFNHFKKVTPDQQTAIEEIVNQKISEAVAVNALNDPKDWVSIEEAKKRWPSVKMFFGEKYGNKVRVVEADPNFSVELCGGTHVKNTSEIGFFKFRTEGSVASGVRRIEAVTADGALELLNIRDRDLKERIGYAQEQISEVSNLLAELERASGLQAPVSTESLDAMSRKLEGFKNVATVPDKSDMALRSFFEKQHSSEHELESLILHIADVRKQLEKELGKFRVKSISSNIDQLIASAVAVDGFKLVSAKVPATTMDELKSVGDTLRAKMKSGVGVLASIIDDKVSLVCVVTDDLVASKKAEAGKIVGAVAKLLGGGGGGRPHLATAGGKDVAKLDEVLGQTKSIVESLIT